jgi:hypothetical protein
MLAELAFDIIDQKVVLMQPRTCTGCQYLKTGDCTLYSGWCVNSIYRPYWQPKLLQQQEEHGEARDIK